MVTRNPPLLSSDALLKYLNTVPANPGPPVADISISAPPSDSASVYKKAAPLDSADWQSVLIEKVRTEFVLRGPYQIKNNFTFLKEKDERRCQHDYFNRVLVNKHKILEKILEEIKTSKYFSIILDCTPDLSHKEQLSVIVRIVSLVEELP